MEDAEVVTSAVENTGHDYGIIDKTIENYVLSHYYAPKPGKKIVAPSTHRRLIEKPNVGISYRLNGSISGSLIKRTYIVPNLLKVVHCFHSNVELYFIHAP